MNIEKLRAATRAAPATDTPQPSRAAPRPHPSPQNAGVPDPAGAAAWCYEQYTRNPKHGPPPAPGNGHNGWLAALTKFWNESGAPLDDALALAQDTAPAGHDAAKIAATVRGIYQREPAAHGSKPYTAPRPGGRTEPPRPLPDTFAPTVYAALPDYLRRCCEPFEGHEKAVMLLGTLAVLSGCFPGVGGTYGKRRNGLNLFVFIIAPAASGKGALGWARRLAWPWHKRLTNASKAARAEYEAELAAHRAATKGKHGPPTPAPTEPPQQLLFLPGNTTAAALLAALADNEGRGIMCETEADTLSGALGNDFGNFSDVLRKAFHYEPVSLIRKTDRQHLDLERPALSIALTGTPGQLPTLMPTAENGLVSRFLFYSFEQEPVWQDVGPDAGPPLDPVIDRLGQELSRMIEATPSPIDTETYPVEIKLARRDWQRVNEAGAVGLAEAAEASGGAGAGTAFRLGLIAWRIAGLLTLLRCFENGEARAGTLEADPADVGTALAIMDTARAHALAVLATLPVPGGARGGRFAAKAEQESKARELHGKGLSYRQIAEQTGVPFRTVGNWLKSS